MTIPKLNHLNAGMDKSARYQPKQIETRWQRSWEREEIFKVSEAPRRPKFYCLVMFPYPSGRIHMGHVRNYAIGDVIARYKTLRGYVVLHPMGWDAFGLPAENAAIEKGIHPAQWTRQNIAAMRRQIKKLGLSYDWSREISTSEENYYRWNQWFFLKMYERGLAYKKMSSVNWCPSCQTVLANEQVVDGQCWRCETVVEQKELSQWFFKITQYAQELLDYCDRLTGWPERVLAMQKNWIGRSEGVEVDFPLADGQGVLKIFTTRQDTLFGATFVVLAPEHPMVQQLIQEKTQAGEVTEFVLRVRQQDKKIRTAQDLEKEGVFTGSYTINPLTHERIPIWVANFVLMEYGTGAIMSVPAHDQRDFDFAKKYGLPIRVVIQTPEASLESSTLTQAYTEEAGYLVESGQFNRLSPEEAKPRIAQYIEQQGLGKCTVNYKLRDWGISRQRYWGTPIPILYCEECGIVPVPENELPVRLPRNVPFTGKGGSPLLENQTFLKATCPRCHRKARRETDTMDTFVDSSWYFLRYVDPHVSDRPINSKAASYWMPVDQYIGGIEHAVLHLLYARFFTKVIRDMGLIQVDEPFTRLLTQGMVVKESYYCPEHQYLFPEQVDKQGMCKLCLASGSGTMVEVGRTEKMSKSKKNVIDPEALIGKYGADTARIFTLFAAPPEKDLEWSDEGVEGAHRFLNRVWRLVIQYAGGLKKVRVEPKVFQEVPAGLKEIRRSVHRTIKKVTEDIEADFHFNTAIAALMELVNTLYLAREKHTSTKSMAVQDKTVWKEALQIIVILLSPFAPHIAEELWKRLGNTSSILKATWPVHDEAVIKTERMALVIQVNGKLRGKMEVAVDLQEEVIKQQALADPKIQSWTSGKPVRNVIYVPGRLVNIVI
ncbi:MAG: leucine--tRNA ligase [Nitrospira sp.]|nr:leucine--tRNA ligase [Nitrospira sp.]